MTHDQEHAPDDRRGTVPANRGAALRDYADTGLVYTVGRSGSNYRLFDSDALWCVGLIRELRGLGLTVAEIRELAGVYLRRNSHPIGPLLAQRLRASRTRIEARIADLHQTLHRIDAYETGHRAELAGHGGVCWADDPRGCTASAGPSPRGQPLPSQPRATLRPHGRNPMSTDTDDAASRLQEAMRRAEGADTRDWLMQPLLTLLANGKPVTVQDIAAATGHAADEVRQALAALPSLERDEHDRIVGYGITLRPTPHRFELDGTVLYTWCALDTLIVPAQLGRIARVESPCHATGTPVRVTVDPSGISDLDPATAVVSLVTPEDLAQVRTAFCNQVHFFASPDAAKPWLEQHPGATVLPVAEAYHLGRTLEPTINPDATPGSCC